ncbi:MAG: hypothetical protein OES09_00120 [Gammaproteobacteria bacterium]|nr:hypothetical protein [Gammaproteobacteria bacterium]
MAETTIHQGQDVVLTMTVYEDAAKTTVKDLTGATIEYRVGDKSNAHRHLSVTSVASAAGSVTAITDDTGGILTVTLKAADMGLPAKTYDHQVRVTDAAGNLDVVYDDRLTFTAAIP